jgi:hypothetical protein
MRAVFEFPQKAVDTPDIFLLAGGRLVVLHVHIIDSIPQAVGLRALPPAPVLDHIVCASLSSMAKRFERIAADRAEACSTVTGAHIHRICGMSKVKASSVFPKRRNVASRW